jgi:glycosyltransferase involved in cell wall biosynthesis
MPAYRVLMIAPTPFYTDRGCHVRIAGEARALQRLGHRVTVCTYHNGRNVADLDIRRIPRVPWYRKTSAGPSVHKPYLDLMLGALAARVAREFRPDVIHAHLHEGAFIAAGLRRFVRTGAGTPTPVVFDFQGSLTGELVAHRFVRAGGIAFRGLHGLERWITAGAGAIVPSSRQAGELLRREFAVPDDRLEVVADGLDPETFRPMACRAEMRAVLQIPPDAAVIGYLGVLAPYQGIDCLLEALPAVVAREPRAHLLLMGWPNVERYAALARSLGVAEHVTLPGEIAYDEAPRYLAAVDVAVAPKLVTTESNHKIRNYMACGLPTVAFDLSLNREILGEFGIYVAELTRSSLAGVLIGALGDRGRLAELGARCREVAVRDFSWERAALRITGVYERLAAAPERQPASAPLPLAKSR